VTRTRIITRGGGASLATAVACLVAACGSTSSSTAVNSSATGAASTASTAASPQYTAADVKGGVVMKATPGWKPLHLAVFGFAASNSYTESEAHGMQQEVDKLNDGSTYTFFDGNFSPTTQVQQIEDAVVSGKYNAFAIGPIDPAAVVPAVKQAVAAGIKVGAWGFPIGPNPVITDSAQVPGVVMTLGNSPYDDGAITAGRAKALCAGQNPCNIVDMTGPRTEPDEAIRYQSVQKTLAPNDKIILACDGNDTDSGGFACMQNALAITHHINVVITASADQMLSGAQKLLDDDGIKIGDQNAQGLFKFVGLGASQNSVKQVRAGLWDSTRVYLGYPTLSSIMVMSLYANVNGHGSQWPQAFNVDQISPIGPLATKATLAADPKFVGEWVG
jgi:ribose transport system substrate-binding protein